MDVCGIRSLVGVGQLEEVFLLVLWVAALEYIYVAEDLGLHGAHCNNLSAPLRQLVHSDSLSMSLKLQRSQAHQLPWRQSIQCPVDPGEAITPTRAATMMFANFTFAFKTEQFKGMAWMT